MYMTCTQCGRACFLAGCEGGDSRGGGGGVYMCVSGVGRGGVTSQIFVRRMMSVKPLKYDPFYNSELTSFRPIFIILTKFSIQRYIFEPKHQELRSIFIILVNITHQYL